MSTANSNKFATLFRSFRIREGLSQRKVASVLEVDESTIARLEAGTRKPPRDPEFYARLRDIPGFTDEDVVDLLHTEDTPRWVIALQDRSNPKPPVTSEPQEVAVAGVKAKFTLEADESRFSPDKIEYIGDMIRRDIDLCIRDFINHDAKRSKLIREN
jgi:transcriptional regulator with XRE-family HTH domain